MMNFQNSLKALQGMEEDIEFMPLITLEEEGDGKKDVFADVIPVLPLRNTVLFPGVVIPITVGRDKSIKAVRDAYAADRFIGVIAQLDSNVEEPEFKDLHKVGTMAKILKMLKMPDGSTTAIIQGKVRFSIREFIASDPYFKATIDVLSDIPYTDDKQFEAIVANPPFSAKWSANPLFMSDERFSQYGKLAPKTKADYAFITHMIYQLADNGTMACVAPHGVLFRGAAEGTIREYLIKELNYLDAVIGLPANLFYGTSIPTCILVFKKCRERDDNVVFIDASSNDYYLKVGNQNELRDEDVERIVNTYRNRETIEKYSYVATLAEIAENDYNLNIPRYVDTFEEEEPIDLEQVSATLKAIEEELAVANSGIAGYCAELGIPTPF